ncbi:MAG TPA: hypothetical protein VME40_11245 [Caulobacteraceae bacterium]|nr:hypothetical protein [Caulobacteraceae bacterium]
MRAAYAGLSRFALKPYVHGSYSAGLASSASCSAKLEFQAVFHHYFFAAAVGATLLATTPALAAITRLLRGRRLRRRRPVQLLAVGPARDL